MSKRVDIPATELWHPGEDKSHVIAVTDENGAAQVMTGWAMKYSLRRTIFADTLSPFTDKTVGSGIVLSNGLGTNSIATITINASDTSGMTGNVFYVLERTDSGSEGFFGEGIIPFGE